MVDIHCHILPGVDDGAHSLEEACAMVEMAAADGITQVVATPHCNARYPFSLERNRTLRAELAAATGGRLTLSCGCDFHLSYENLERVLVEPSTFTINQRNYLLVEFAEYGMVVTDTMDISGDVTGFDPFGNIPVTVLDVAGQPGEFEDEVGRVVSVNATASSFVFEPFGSCEQLTIATDVATRFAAFDRISLTNTFSSLQAGQVVEVNADLKIDASFVAEKVEFEDDATEDETQGFITDVTRATGPSQDSFGLVLMDVTPCNASLPLVEVARVDVSTLLNVVDFRIDDDGFTTVDPALFDGAEDLVAGQKVSLDPVQALGLSPLTAQQIRLEDVTILGTVDSSPISSLAFNLVPRAAFMAGVDPSITVQLSTADTGFENLPNGTSDLFVGRNVRVRGLLFRDTAGELFLVAKRVDGTPLP